MTCYDCIHCDVCSGIGACSYHCSDVSKCKHFKNKADFVEVPCRCGDCKNYNNHLCAYFETFMFDDDFCSYGERKDEQSG